MKILLYSLPVIAMAAILSFGSAEPEKVSPASHSYTTDKPLLTTTIPSRQWLSAINLQLLSLKIKINNFTPTDFQDTSSNTFRWYKKNDCLFQIGIRPNEVRQTFTLLPFRQDPMTIYIQNLNKSRATASVVKGKIKIRIDFEQAELEIRTNCIENLGCGAIGNPNFNIDRPAIEVTIEPIISAGKLSYQNGTVRLFGSFNHEGFNITVGVLQEIAKMFSFDVNSFIQREGARYMQNYLNSPGVVADVTDKLNMTLERARMSGFSFPPNMRSLVLDGAGNMVITHD